MGWWRRVVAVGGIFAAASGAMVPVTAESPVFNDMYYTAPVAVQGSYTPLSGRFDCGNSPAFGILWYAAGTARDRLWTNLGWHAMQTHQLPHDTSWPITVNGVYEPFVGDFDGDFCDDIFWYAPGSGADYVWYTGPRTEPDSGPEFKSVPVTAGHDRTPVVGNFDGGAPGDDIFWYGEGGGTESIWSGTTTRGVFAKHTAPQVAGTDYRIEGMDDGIVFYRPGPGADYFWDEVVAGLSAPGESTKSPINGYYQLHYGPPLLLYAPGPGTDRMLMGANPDGTPLYWSGTINGDYRVSVAPSSYGAGVFVFHAPGSAADYIWANGWNWPPE